MTLRGNLALGSCGRESAAWGWLALCLVGTAAVALGSNGAYHDDDLKHYLFARWVRFDPQYLSHVWGRPGFTLLYVLPAQVGWWACRLMSVGVSGVAAWATFRSAQRLGLRRAVWAIPLIYSLPLFLHLSTTTLTETPAAAYLAVATWALLAGRMRVSAFVFSLALITRHEAIVLLPVWAWAIGGRGKDAGFRVQGSGFGVQDSGLSSELSALSSQLTAVSYQHSASSSRVPALSPQPSALSSQDSALSPRRGRWVALGLLLWAPLAYNLATWAAFGYLPGEVFSRPSGAIHYGQGTPLTFVLRFIVMAGPVVATLFVVGCRAVWPNRRGRVLVAGVIVYVAVETGLYMFQAYATGGYARFLVPLAPWVALVALAGADAVLDGGRSAGALWLGAAIALWACAEVEHAVNPIAGVAGYFWLFRLGALGLVLGIAGWVMWPRGRRVCVVVVALGLLGPVGRAAWPHRLRPRESVIAEAIGALGGGVRGRAFYSTSDWSYYFAERWYPARHRPLYEELGVAPAGSLLIWERRYGPSPDFNLSLEALRVDPHWRELYRSPPDDAGGSFVYGFERWGG